MLEPGSKIDLTYPEKTLVDQLEHCRRRRIRVIKVRDLMAEPLTVAEFLRRPLLNRSRWLITGFDEDIGKPRQFYLGSSVEFRAPQMLKVALYEPESPRPAYAISRPFGPSKRDRMLMAKALASWSLRDIEDMQLGIYADDLSVVVPTPPRIILSGG
ncbi:hypothetical protein [Aporhodopirellula aestuarii]|uniref:WYL domain-containing protein n=1 Tax=Aporhodopirellula aestuarii TaxID=2950107 RepID=A0ABT0U2W0_9BACT|nr:hypothetical protein [Aporhodopirellula aestuarii]MCM2370931.1 hypothetical protein [Aporhodopirellula aestuarii]